jgi:hypothetical protein
LGRHELDSGVDLDPVADDPRDDRPGQLAGRGIGLDLGQLALQHGRRGALPEVRLEHGRERDAPPGAQAPDPVTARLGGSVHRQAEGPGCGWLAQRSM